MSYFDYLNDFLHLQKSTHLSGNARLLYYSILSYANDAGWPDCFQLTNHRLMDMLDTQTERVARKARQELLDHGLLLFLKGNKNTPSTYRLRRIGKHYNNQTDRNSSPFSAPLPDQKADNSSPKQTPDKPHQDPLPDCLPDRLPDHLPDKKSGNQSPLIKTKTKTKTKTELKEKNNYYNHFVPPTVDEVTAFCQERCNQVDGEQFVAYYASKGWMMGKSPMKDWKQAVISWEKNMRTRERSMNHGVQTNAGGGPKTGWKLRTGFDDLD